MKNLSTVFRYEITQQFARKAFLFVTFGLPLLAFILFGGYLFYDDLRSGDEEEVSDELEGRDPLGYIDRTRFFALPDDESPLAPYIIEFDDLEAGIAALENEEIGQFYEIEADYFETGTVTQWLDRFNFDAIESDLFEAFLVLQMAQGSDPEVVARLRYPLMSLTEQRIERTAEGEIAAKESNFDTDFLQVYVFAMQGFCKVRIAGGKQPV